MIIKGFLRYLTVLLILGVFLYITTYLKLVNHYIQLNYITEDEEDWITEKPKQADENAGFTELPLEETDYGHGESEERYTTKMVLADDSDSANQNDPEIDKSTMVPVSEKRTVPTTAEASEDSFLDADLSLEPELPPKTLNYSNIFDSSSAAQFPRAKIEGRTRRRTKPNRMNVLFLVVDDLRPQINPYNGFPNLFPDDVFRMHTPNLDSLARRSLLLRHAYVQYSSCNPSRASYMTSRRPDTTKVWNLSTFWRRSGGNFTTIPQFFGARGYRTTGMGKIFHPGPGGGFNDPQSWNDGHYIAPHGAYWSWKNTTADFWKAVARAEREAKPLPDEELTVNAVNRLRKYAPRALSGEEPFFLAVGFLKPHLPIVFPEEFLQLYPPDELSMPTNVYMPKHYPEQIWAPPMEVLNCADVNYTEARQMNVPFPDDMTRKLRRAYFAGVSYVDYLIGIVLSELESLGLAENTIVSFLGDHGWHLGEQGYWGKHTNFDLGVQAPLMIHIPGRTDAGLVSDSIIEFTDVFPTIVEATGFDSLEPCPPISGHVELCTEGRSFLKLVDDPRAKIRDFAFSQHRLKHEHMGYTVRTDRYRYTETVTLKHEELPNGYFQFRVQWDNVLGRELYDHRKDPQESENVADYSMYRSVVSQLSDVLHSHFHETVTNLTQPFTT